MIDDINMTSHTYHGEIAEKIFSGLKGYLPLIKKVLNTIKEVCKGS
jgi:hypothetical protein